MIHSRLIVGALLILSMLLFAGIAACGEAATSEPDTDSAAATTEDSSTSEEATTESETSTESESTTEDQAGTEDESEADTSTTSTTGTTPSTSTDSTTSSTTQETTEGEEDSAMVMREVSDALKQYAADNAGRAGAIYVGDINQLVGPAPMDQEGNPDADLADLQGNVPLDALEDHTWLYNSDYYWSLLERAKLTEPTPLTSSGESIELQHVCINRSLLPCKIIEQFWAPNLEDRTEGQLTITVSSFPELGLAGPDTLQLVSDGTIEMANIYTGYVAGELPAIEVQSLWGIYPDWETMYLSLTDMHPQLEQMVAEETSGGTIVNHNWYSGNDQFFFSKKALRTLDDFEGLKTRSHAAALSDWIEGMGADAQFVAFSEVYTALERGILDAGVTGSTPGYGQRWYEVTTYLNGPLKSLLSTNNVINAVAWEDIPADLQQILIEEGAKSELEQLRLTSIQNVTGVQKNLSAEPPMELVEFSPDLADHSLNVAVKQHVIPGWLNRIHYPGDGDEAVAMFNEYVGPYVGMSIGADGTVSDVPITKGPHSE